jgi:4-amino-4-deoxy-L-arabinose transferase-like glycosyltransferase
MSRDTSTPVAILLTLLIATYLAVGTLYAALTPTWQVPDEPAHYNYIRSLAEGEGIPVLEGGDYGQQYLERLTAEGFPAELSIEPLEYEDHQPPLYYLLATPIYRLFGGAVLPLRLMSVALGAGLLAVAFGTVRAVFPKRPGLALVAAGLIAFIPQHVAMSAGVNNDTLAELVVGGTLWALVTYVGRGPEATVRPRSLQAQSGEREERPWWVGLLLATALLTKTTAYVVLGVAVAAVAIRWRREGRPWGWMARQLGWMLVPALVLATPWFLRNGLVYGWSDPLGLARHESIVEGQPRSAEWLGHYGWWGLLSRMARTTFQSFWGQFGWMAVPLPRRIYQMLLLFSGLLAAGFVVWLVRQGRSPQSSRQVGNSATVLAVSALLTLLSFLWYNLTFVQHQGRYLFPALIPLATAAGLGLDTWAGLLPRRLRGWAMSTVLGVLAAFDVYCLFRIVVPNLTR